MTYLQRAGDDPSFTLVKPADTWSEAEVMLFMAGRLDADGNAVTGPLTAAAEVHTGAMIALIPTDADLRRLVDDPDVTEPIDQLHTTLMYLGTAADWSLEQRTTLELRVEKYCSELAPVDADGFAISIFNPPGSQQSDGMDRDTCVVLQCGGDGLAVMHHYLNSAVRDLQRLPDIPPQHQPWVPHVTLAYTDDVALAGQLTSLCGPITFDRVRIAFGGENHDIKLRGTLIATAARDYVRDLHGRFSETPDLKVLTADAAGRDKWLTSSDPATRAASAWSALRGQMTAIRQATKNVQQGKDPLDGVDLEHSHIVGPTLKKRKGGKTQQYTMDDVKADIVSAAHWFADEQGKHTTLPGEQYRGMRVEKPNFHVGDNVDLDMTSWTSKPSIANIYASDTSGDDGTPNARHTWQPVIFKIKNAQGVDVDAHNDSGTMRMHEAVLQGKAKVSSVEEYDPTNPQVPGISYNPLIVNGKPIIVTLEVNGE